MSDYPTLQNFFSAYFHQDWMMEHDTADGVVDAWRDGESDEHVARARDELDRLLARDFDEAALGSTVRGMGSEYDPTREGTTWRDWLIGIQRRLYP